MVEDCSQAVEMNPRYIKALFRRARALERLDNKKECLEGGRVRFLFKKVEQIVTMLCFNVNVRVQYTIQTAVI